ncbi:hypothetical protein DFH09DRAFT_1492565, partial [Mycena vulgaris]
PRLPVPTHCALRSFRVSLVHKSTLPRSNPPPALPIPSRPASPHAASHPPPGTPHRQLTSIACTKNAVRFVHTPRICGRSSSRVRVPLAAHSLPCPALSPPTPRDTAAPHPSPVRAACAPRTRMRASSRACRCAIMVHSVWRAECEAPVRIIHQYWLSLSLTLSREGSNRMTIARVPPFHRRPRAAASASAGKSVRTQLTRTSASMRFRAARQTCRTRDDTNAPPVCSLPPAQNISTGELPLHARPALTHPARPASLVPTCTHPRPPSSSSTALLPRMTNTLSRPAISSAARARYLWKHIALPVAHAPVPLASAPFARRRTRPPPQREYQIIH